jgi:hypothetical protein
VGEIWVKNKRDFLANKELRILRRITWPRRNQKQKEWYGISAERSASSTMQKRRSGL